MRRCQIAPDRRIALLLALCAAAGAVAAFVGAPAAIADPIWRLEQPAPPAGAPFKVALGPPGDLSFWAPNRGLLAVEGNAVSPRGLFLWDGRAWRPISVVCGGSADTFRVIWSSATEFWTISEPSRPRIGNGVTLCRYKDGVVAQSFGTLPQAADPYRPMNAGTCRTPDDCWFGGAAAADPTGSRSGSFRLRWDGSRLTTVYGPQGRGISDLAAHDGAVFESLLAGLSPENRLAAEDLEPESVPGLLHRSAGGPFAALPFEPAPLDGVPLDGSELLALDSDGAQLWAGGGGAASGPAAPLDGAVVRPPLAVRQPPGGGAFTEIPLTAPDGSFGPTDRIVDIAAVPGTDDAWAAIQPFPERRSVNARAKVARIDAQTGAAEVIRLPAAGSGRGSAARIACPAAEQCWLATWGGWLFRYSDGSLLPQDTGFPFQDLVTFRPNESAAQFVPDAPPVDDSLLLAPPPVETEVAPAPRTVTRNVAPLLRNVRSRLRGLKLIVSFRLTRRARVQLIASRRGRVVARTPKRLHRPGRRVLRLRLERRRWPTRLRFSVSEPGRAPAAENENTVSTDPAPADSGTGRVPGAPEMPATSSAAP